MEADHGVARMGRIAVVASVVDAAVPGAQAAELVAWLHAAGVTAASPIGEIVKGEVGVTVH